MDATSTSLAEDLQELQLEKVIPRALKSNEEIEKLTVDEDLSDIERAIYLLSSGQDVQRISVISNLPDLIKNNNEECMRRVVPKVREVLHVAQAEMQLAASSAFLQILQQQIVPIQNYTQTFLQTILTSVESKDPDCANAWLETLLDVIDLLPKDIIKKEILGIAIAKGQLSQSVQARLACCRILGKISTKFESFVIKKEILPVVQSLCQDVDYEVRGCMCQQLDPVARGLGLEATKSAILPELVELTNDEESYVRIIGLETVVNILSLLDNEICLYTIIPLVCKFLQQAVNSQDSTLPVIAKQLGKLCHGMWTKLSEEKKEWFLDQYRTLCRIGLEKSKMAEKDKESPSKTDVSDLFEEEDKKVECRKNSAFNFPSMAYLVGGKHFKQELYPTFVTLCKDPHVSVRKTMASCFHEIARILNTSAHTLQSELSILLRDENIEVIQGVIQHLPETMEVFCKGDSKTITETRINSISEIIPSILSAEIVIFSSNDWRLQETFLKSLACLPTCCNSEDIYDQVIPVLFQKLRTSRAMPVRHAAARTTLIIIRQLRKLEQREQLIHRLISDFCHGKSCHQRSLFIDMCYFFIELYSKSFFKEHLFDYVLELTSDPVANVRLRMCFMLPSLKRQVKLPYDRNHLQLLEAAIRKILVHEQDRDVNAAMKKAVEELDGIQVQMESLMSKRKNFEEDTEDQLKEEEEKKLIIMEEQERKEEELKAKLEKKGSSNSKIPAPKKVAPKSGTSSKSESNRDVKKVSSIPASREMAGITLSRQIPSLLPQSASLGANDIQSQFGQDQNFTDCDRSGLPEKTKPADRLHAPRAIRGPKKYLVKSKSTTCIPSLCPIPRRENNSSRIPLKPKNGQISSRRSLIIIDECKDDYLKMRPKESSVCKIPVFNTTALSGGSKAKGTTKSASAVMSSTARKTPSSTGMSTSSNILSTRRGSLTSAGTSSSDTKAKPKIGGANGLSTGAKNRKISK